MKNPLVNLLSCLLLFTFLSCHDDKITVNDITKINPIVVNQVIRPTKASEISKFVKNSKVPISIGGGRYSMGGQVASEGTAHIDMRSFNRVLNLDKENRSVTVQSGARWRDIQEVIDPEGLSIRIMQTYSNFTVGGSLSVNCHGRYLGAGAVIKSVESIKIVLADGKEVFSSRTENPEIFFAAIGGYGGIGVITEVTLKLAENSKVRREIKNITTEKYRKFFLENIRKDELAVFHNGDLYPPKFNSIAMETWYRTNKPLSEKRRLIPRDKKYWLEPNIISSVSSLPFGKEVRKKIIDPLIRSKEVVTWRNHEASYDVAVLEPTTPRLLFTYVLQEYFIPEENFEKFVPKMRTVFEKYNVNVLNVSIRHALADKESYLSWSPTNVFSFVVYYKQKTTDSAKKDVQIWTRELIDEALSLGGRHYLPYQIHATKQQFKKGYKDQRKFFLVKKKLDPTNKFRNKLWDEYYTSM